MWDQNVDNCWGPYGTGVVWASVGLKECACVSLDVGLIGLEVQGFSGSSGLQWVAVFSAWLLLSLT